MRRQSDSRRNLPQELTDPAPLIDDDIGGGVAEVGERGGRVHAAGRLDPGQPFGPDDLGERGDQVVATAVADHDTACRLIE